MLNKFAIERLQQLGFEALELDSILPPENKIDWDNLNYLKLLYRILAK